MRSTVATLGLCAAILVAYTTLTPGKRVSAQSCGGCVPSRMQGVQLSGNYKVCFDQNTIGGEPADKMAYGFQNYWAGIGVSFNYAIDYGLTLGGNGNGWFDTGDRYFDRTKLWRDSNHDGISQPDELLSLRSVGLSGISLKYIESRRKDRWGNSFRYRARVVDEKGHDIGNFAYDVFLIAEPRSLP